MIYSLDKGLIICSCPVSCHTVSLLAGLIKYEDHKFSNKNQTNDFHLLYSTSVIPSCKTCVSFPGKAIALKALLLSTKSVVLVLSVWISVTTIVVPALLQTAVFLHLICSTQQISSVILELVPSTKVNL